MVGSVDYNDAAIDGQVNVALRRRQPGSTLKPFTYLTAFAQGWAPATMVMDVPTTFGGTYTPLNYDKRFRGPVSVRRALAQSLNIPAVKALEFVGIDAMLTTAHRMGINGLRDPARYGLSVTLGGGEVTLLDLTYAYTPFANNGLQAGLPLAGADRDAASRQFEPVGDSGDPRRRRRRALRAASRPSRSASSTRPGLPDHRHPRRRRGPRRDVRRATARSSSRRPAAAKTGTTDDFRDSWVVGYTPDLVTGVWVGNSDGSPMRDVLSASGAGRVWHTFMEAALADGRRARSPARPASSTREVCELSGLLPTPGVPRDASRRSFAPANLPNQPDDLYRRVEVCKVNGKLAFELVPANAREARCSWCSPSRTRDWGPRTAIPPPPSQRCDDVYRGVKVAEIDGAGAGDAGRAARSRSSARR